MPKKRIKFAWLRMLFFGFLLVVFVGQTASAGEPEVTYDKASDSLTVQADGVSLEGLLARIAILSGVEFLMDPEVEQPVSITLRDSPLEDGLKKTMQTLNLGYAMIYQEREGRDGSTGPLLISMKVLPKAMDNYSHLNLVPVVDVNGEAVIILIWAASPRWTDASQNIRLR